MRERIKAIGAAVATAMGVAIVVGGLYVAPTQQEMQAWIASLFRPAIDPSVYVPAKPPLNNLRDLEKATAL